MTPEYAMSVLRRMEAACLAETDTSRRQVAVIGAVAALHTCETLGQWLFCLQCEFGPDPGDADFAGTWYGEVQLEEARMVHGSGFDDTREGEQGTSRDPRDPAVRATLAEELEHGPLVTRREWDAGEGEQG